MQHPERLPPYPRSACSEKYTDEIPGFPALGPLESPHPIHLTSNDARVNALVAVSLAIRIFLLSAVLPGDSRGLRHGSVGPASTIHLFDFQRRVPVASCSCRFHFRGKPGFHRRTPHTTASEPTSGGSVRFSRGVLFRVRPTRPGPLTSRHFSRLDQLPEELTAARVVENVPTVSP